MDTLFHDWNSEIGVEFPLPIQRKSLGLENELIELLWQNGEVVLQSQTNRKQSHDPSKTGPTGENSSNSLIQRHENFVGSWMDCPIDESFEKEFCAHVLPKTLSLQKGTPGLAPLLSPPRPCFGSVGVEKVSNVVEEQALSGGGDTIGALECSAKTIGSSNRVANEICSQKVAPWSDSVEMGMLEQVITSSCRDDSCWMTGSQSIDTYGQKRKNRDIVESECRSDATELESGSGNKSSSQKSRRVRVAEVHNLSERRRRDRINEKMKALQELIPHSNKSDKASMLDEAIEYMKSLQLQLQFLWMGSGMAPMMLPGMQPYMSHMGMRLGPMLPAIQNLMRLSRFPVVDPTMTMSPSPNQATLSHNAMLNSINYQNQMQNLSFPDQYANFMGFQLNGSQPNMFNYGSHLAQQNQTIPPKPTSNGSNG